MTDREKILAKITEKYNTVSPIPEQADRFFMSAALELAKAAAVLGEVPVGCVIVREGKIIAADFNGREETKDAVYHAECSAISKACRVLGGWRLTGCTLYVTLEPCPMCAGAIWNARVPRVVIGARDAKAGALGSLINLNAYPLNHKPLLTFGVLEKETAALLRDFFSSRRNPVRGKELY
ncbi:MAG: nucleoside deaminase [Ruminococcaceae bacterium]|nr:nucleoside deaminase [Oscillospiraceae bacterium]